MENKKNWLILLIVLNIGFIWGNSMMNPDKSHEFSNFVYDLLGRLFSFGRDELPQDGGEHLLRKFAHAFEFMVLGVLITARFGKKSYKRIGAIVLSGITVAACDETIQIFTNRGSAVRDVLIDTVGFVTGVALAGLIIYLIIIVRKKKEIKRLS